MVITPQTQSSELTFENALKLSASGSVEWKLYQELDTAISIPQIEERITYLETNLKPKYVKYCNPVLLYLKSELLRRQAL